MLFLKTICEAKKVYENRFKSFYKSAAERYWFLCDIVSCIHVEIWDTYVPVFSTVWNFKYAISKAINQTNL